MNMKVDENGLVTLTNEMGRICEVGQLKINTAENREKISRIAKESFPGKNLCWQQAIGILMQVNKVQDTMSKRDIIRSFGLAEPPANISDEQIVITQNGNTISVTITNDKND